MKGFKEIPKHAGYAINKNGLVHSAHTDRILTAHDAGKGYLKVGLTIEGKLVNRYIHYLLCITFKEKLPHHNCIRHLNGMKLDNSLENLIWGTQKQNMIDKKLHEYNSAISKCIFILKKNGADTKTTNRIKSLYKKIPKESVEQTPTTDSADVAGPWRKK